MVGSSNQRPPCVDMNGRSEHSDRLELNFRESEAQLRAIFEGAAIGITLVDLTGRPVKCNPALTRLLGYTEAELCSMAFPEFTHPADLDADLELYHSLVSGQREHYQIEKRYIRKDGQIVWARLTVSLIHPSAGKPQFAVAMVEDITARKNAEQALRESEERSFKAIQGNPNPILITRRSDSRVVEANQAFATWFGIPLAGARGKSTFELGIWKTTEERDELMKLLQLQGSISNYPKIITLPSGEERITLLTVQPLTINSEACLFAIATDITQQKQAELSLLRSEERLRRGLEAARMGTWEWDIASNRVNWSEGVHSVFGLAPGEFAGTYPALFAMIDPADRDRFQLEIREVLENPRHKYHSELRVRPPDGSCRWLEARGEVRCDELGTPVVMLGTVVDVTEQKRAALALRSSEESLREAQARELRSREEFTRQLLNAEEQERQRLAAELHDSLGQNLSIIKNQAYLALAHPGLPPTVVGHLNSISQSAAETIAGVRDLVRNLRPIQIEQLGLTDSLRDLVDKVAQSTSVRINVRIEDVDDVIKGDSATHLYRIVQEALNNLIKHSGAGQANVCLERDITCVRFRLSDNGGGFEVNDASVRGGFGLTNIAERAQILGGTMRIESLPGAGTRLVVELPIREEEGRAP
jgi:PAS domain S-box-containing protein